MIFHIFPKNRHKVPFCREFHSGFDTNDNLLNYLSDFIELAIHDDTIIWKTDRKVRNSFLR